MADVTERQAAEERQRLLIAELNHRVKNTLAIVLGIADQTRRATGGSGAAGAAPDLFHAGFRARLLALSRAHDLLTREAWHGAALDEVVGGALAPHAPGTGGGPAGEPPRVVVVGPPVKLAPEPAVALAMAFHELASNAVKHGALAAPGGRVAVRWRPAADGRALEVGWTETGGPPVAPPRRRGFGVRLLERGLARQLAGEVALDFAPAGLHCRMRLPLSERVALG